MYCFDKIQANFILILMEKNMSLNNLISPIKDSINCKATLQDILDAMIENHTKHFVLIENKKPVGIITERDILLLYTNHVNLNLKAINYAKKT